MTGCGTGWRRVDRKLRKDFRFHYKITMDGVSISLLYSRPMPPESTKMKMPGAEQVHCSGATDSVPPSKCIGQDPGKRNIATMTDKD